MAFTPGKTCVICAKNIIGTGLKCDRCGQKVHKSCWNRANADASDETPNEKLYCRARDPPLDHRTPMPPALEAALDNRFARSVWAPEGLGAGVGVGGPTNPSPPPTLNYPSSSVYLISGSSNSIITTSSGLDTSTLTPGADRYVHPHLRYLPHFDRNPNPHPPSSNQNHTTSSFVGEDQQLHPQYPNLSPLAQPYAAPFVAAPPFQAPPSSSNSACAFQQPQSTTTPPESGAATGSPPGTAGGAAGPATGGRASSERSSPSPSPSTPSTSPGPSVSPTNTAASTLKRSKPVPKNARDSVTTTLKRQNYNVCRCSLLHISLPFGVFYCTHPELLVYLRANAARFAFHWHLAFL